MNAKMTPYGNVPWARQILWQSTEVYSIVHFGLNTFSGKEWGYGDEAPALFNPSNFDPLQWAKVCVDSGIRGVILVCKHHDGFCLWPTKTTEHCVRNSPWKEGRGDLVAEVAAACREYGLKFGVYISPWDRNHTEYGNPGYVPVYHQQLCELLTGYGELFEVWFDGANGGDGFYGGARERRSIDPATYYQWERIRDLVRTHQPNACMFGVFDIRYVGNENGVAEETCWATQTFQGHSSLQKSVNPSTRGDRKGDWMPPECDFPLRKGWFFHASDEIKSSEGLFERYLTSVGRGGTMNVGIAPDQRGLIHEDDIRALAGWKKLMDDTFSCDLLQASGVGASANNTRAEGKLCAPALVLDGKADTYWTAEDKEPVPELIFEFPHPVRGNVISLREFLPLGQRVDAFAVDGWQDGEWREIGTGTSIGHRRLLVLRQAEIARLRVRFTETAASPAIREIALYRMPTSLLKEGKLAIVRDRKGEVDIRASKPGLTIRYTTDGSEPDENSSVFTKAFPFPQGGTVKACGFLPGEEGGRLPEVSATFGINRSGWRLVSTSLNSQFDNNGTAGVEKLLDDEPDTYWHTYHQDKCLSAPPHEVVLDMGRQVSVEAFTFQPRLTISEPEAIPDQYAFYLSDDGEQWTLAAEGEFSNIKASPSMRLVPLSQPKLGRFLRFVAKHVIDDGNYVAVAGLGVVEA